MKAGLHISRRRLIAAAAAGTLAAGGAIPRVNASEPVSRVVVELFTSQGCSSCPPADAFMEELRERGNVTALTLNVDYWDYLGWRDTLGSREYSDRQRQYARRRGGRNIYTPQMVINGKTHVVGSKREEVLAAIEAEALASRADAVPVALSRSGGKMFADIGGAGANQTLREATVWLVMVRREVPIQIERGENRGSYLTYYNVARKFMPVGTWHGEATRLEYNLADLVTGGHDACCILLQVDGNGPIIGAADATFG